MIVTVSKWGNSQGIRLPKELLAKVDAAVGAEMDARVEDGRIVIEPSHPKKHYDIKALVKEIKKGERHTEHDWGKPAGGEIW